MAKKRSSFGMQSFPVQCFRNSVSTAASGTPVYDPVDFDLQYEANEVMRLLCLEMWLSNSDAIDDPPTDGVTRVRGALLDDPNATISIQTASEFDSRPEIVDYTEAVWAHQVDAAPTDKIFQQMSHYKQLVFPGGGLLVGRNMQYTAVVVETASGVGLSWELRTQLWCRRERVSDAMFKQIMYGVRF